MLMFHRPCEACKRNEGVRKRQSRKKRLCGGQDHPIEVKNVKYTVSLKENRQFRRLYAKGKSVVSPSLVLYYRKTNGRENRLGITVSGKLGNAVTRNKIRRRLREIYRTNEASFVPGCTIVVVARVRAVSASYRELQRTFLTLSAKAGLLRQAEGNEG